MICVCVLISVFILQIRYDVLHEVSGMHVNTKYKHYVTKSHLSLRTCVRLRICCKAWHLGVVLQHLTLIS